MLRAAAHKKGRTMAKLETVIKPWPEEKMKQYQWLDECLLDQPATVKEFQPSWQAMKYLLRDKMYAYIGMNDKSERPLITLKLEPEFSELMRREYEDIVPGYYMNKMHWSSVYLDGAVPQDVIVNLVQNSYGVMLSSLSKKAQQEILATSHKKDEK